MNMIKELTSKLVLCDNFLQQKEEIVDVVWSKTPIYLEKKNLSVYNWTQTHDTSTVTCAVVRPSQISRTATSDQKLL